MTVFAFMKTTIAPITKTFYNFWLVLKYQVRSPYIQVAIFLRCTQCSPEGSNKIMTLVHTVLHYDTLMSAQQIRVRELVRI